MTLAERLIARLRRNGGPARTETLRAGDVWRMRRNRADYYAYVADMLSAQAGRRSLRALFDSDARRYGVRTARGRLSHAWSQRFELTGGQLNDTWAGVFPEAELSLIDVAQRDGVHALAPALSALGQGVALSRQLVGTLSATTAAGCVAAAVVWMMLWAIPHYTLPRLKTVFAMVPPTDWFGAAARLSTLADWLTPTLPMIAVTGMLLTVATAWGASRVTGPMRHALDRLPLVRLYRDLQAIRFLSTLALLVRDPRELDTRLRDALSSLAVHASPYMAMHLDAMRTAIDQGHLDADIFDTGLLDRPLYWFLSDVIRASGLADGLRRTQQRAETTLVQAMTRQAMLIRWTTLGVSVATALTLLFWHVAAIDDLRRALSYSTLTG